LQAGKKIFLLSVVLKFFATAALHKSSDKHAIDCRALMSSNFYKQLFPTRLSPEKRAAADFLNTARGSRKATSVGGVLTARGADFIVIDDPLQPDKALSDARRKAVND